MKPHARFCARGTRRKPGVMNKLEASYAQELERRKMEGEIEWWAYEAVTLKLADRCRYTPDFLVLLANGELECHETKGFMRDDARVKLKVAAEQFPIRFVLVRARAKRDGGGFVKEII